jgi:hypothetical protein
MHWLNKHIFADKNWIVIQEQPPSNSKDDSLRRCDAIFEWASRTELWIIAIAEAKKKGGSLMAVETQLSEACQTSSIRSGRAVCGLAIVGVHMKFFEYQGNGVWAELTTGYMNANDATYSPVIRTNAIMFKTSVETQLQSTQTQVTRPMAQNQYSQTTPASASQNTAQWGYQTAPAATTQTERRPKPAGEGWLPHTSGRWYRSNGGKYE